ARGTEYEQIHGLARVGIAAGKQRAHVARNPRYAEEAAAVVEQVLDLGSAHGAFAHEIGHGTGIESARSRSHDEPVKRGKAHRGIDAAPSMHRAEARAIAKMCNNHAAFRHVRIDRAELLRDELVRQSVEAVPLHAVPFISAG